MIIFNILLTLSNFWHYYKKYAVGTLSMMKKGVYYEESNEVSLCLRPCGGNRGHDGVRDPR